VIGLDWLSASYALSLICHRAAGVNGTIAEFTAAMQQLSLMLFVDHKFMTQAVQLSFIATLTKLKIAYCFDHTNNGCSECLSAVAF